MAVIFGIYILCMFNFMFLFILDHYSVVVINNINSIKKK